MSYDKNFISHSISNLSYSRSIIPSCSRYLLDKNIKSNQYIYRKRIILIFIIISLLYLILMIRLIDVSQMNYREITQVMSHNKKNLHKRSDIIDRNGVILATNIDTFSLYAHPRQIIKIEDAASNLASILNINSKDILRKLKSQKQFVWLKRHITPNEQNKVRALGIPGIYEVSDEKRIYPNDNLFSHLVGYVDVDGNGIAGVEKSFHNQLLENSSVLQLSVDARLQYALQNELSKSIHSNNAIGGFGIIADVNNGEILAMTSLPDFDPNHIDTKSKDQKSLFNQASLGVNEMGSTFKILTIAMGLDTGKVKLNEAFDVSEKIQIGRFKIGDYRGKGGLLSVPEILIYSSNIGVAQIAKKVGLVKQKEYWRKIGMLSSVNMPLPELGRPIYPSDNRWSDVHLITMSYGHGIAVTAVHTTQAISAVVNGGILYEPSILKIKDDSKLNGNRVFSANTSKIMRGMLRLVVEYGYAKKAEVSGYFVGGKTGTAEKVHNGKYNKKLNLASCIAVFPIHDPKYVIFLAIDEAKGNKINGGFTTGGMIAAPIMGEVIKKVSSIVGLKFNDSDNREITKQLFVEYTPRHRMLASR